MRRVSRRALVILGLLTLAPLAISTAAAQRTAPIIVDHRSTDLSSIPVDWILQAKTDLHIAYGHTSHGSQLTTGMTGLAGWKGDLYAWNRGGAGGALDLDDGGSGVLVGDVGYYPQWYNATLAFLGDYDPSTGRGVNHPNVNVIIWSWCGQASGRTEETMLSTYLTPMSELEAMYPGVTFVYMTGHLDGSGASGNLNLRNQQIRDYVIAHNKVLYDFADIESYDPDRLVNYMELLANDNCQYDSDANGTRDRNWCLDWQGSHVEGVDWYNVSAAHSQALNGNLKAYAAWWLWARLAGWNDQEALSMEDASVVEGGEPGVSATPFADGLPAYQPLADGMTDMVFTATLSAAYSSAVTVNYTTVASGAATEGVDYIAASGTVTFEPNEVSKTITIQIVGDLIHEPDETFSVVLSNPVNATIEDGEGIGTILNDDFPALSASIADVTLPEGNSGSTSADFVVTLSGPATQQTTIDYATTDGTAIAASGDYDAIVGTLVIPQNATSGTISVVVNGDTEIESDETFTVTLSNAWGATIADGSATGTITNDDSSGSEPTAVVWTSAVGVAVSSNNLTKNVGTGWNAGAVSSQQLTGDGYVEFTAVETNTFRLIGLSNGNPGTTYAEIDFAIDLANNGAAYVYESGTYRATLGSYANGDTFQIEVVDSVVYYIKNGTVLYTSSAAPTLPLLVDTALYTGGATVSNALVWGDWTAPVPPPTTPVTWESAVGVSISTNSLTKAATTGWNAGAVSAEHLASGDGYVEFTVAETNTFRVIGLSNGNPGTTYTEIDYAIDLADTAVAYVYESGTYRASLGAYVTGDKFQIEVVGGAVRYKKNGIPIFTSPTAPIYPLLVDTALYTTGSTLNNVVVVGNWSTQVVWTSAVGVTVDANNLTKTAGTGWNAGAVSSQQLTGDGYAEFTASETNTFRVVGLSNGNPGTTYAEIDFGIDLTNTAVAYVYESGTYRASLGSYTTGDTFQIEVVGSVVRYKKNGSILFVSPTTPTLPLLIDTALYTAGCTLNDAVISGSWTAPAAPPTTPVTWVSDVGVTVSGNDLTKTAAAGWNAGAASDEELASGDGYVEFTVAETNTYRMLGLSNGDPGTTYSEIDFGINLTNSGVAYVYENGTYRAGLGTYAPGDKLQVEVISGVVRYKKNGVTFYSSSIAPTYPLLVDTALYTQGATLNSVVVVGDWTAAP